MPEPAGPPADHAIDRSSLGAQNARLAERSFQKIVLQCQLPDLGMQSLQVDSRFTTSGSVIEHTGSALQKLRFPLRDLIRMNVKSLRKGAIVDETMAQIIAAPRGEQATGRVSPADATETIGAWRIDHNTSRPHSAISNLTPAAF